MQEIILNGMTLGELKAQKLLVSKDASKFIAENTKKVEELVADILLISDIKETEELCKEANDILNNIHAVSNVSGVEYYFDYSSEWEEGDNVMSKKLHDLLEDLNYSYYSKSAFKSLISSLKDMERNTASWNTSTC